MDGTKKAKIIMLALPMLTKKGHARFNFSFIAEKFIGKTF
jgi:hypothetical protein